MTTWSPEFAETACEPGAVGGSWRCAHLDPPMFAAPWRPVKAAPRDDGPSLDAMLARLTVDPPAVARWGVVYDGRLAPVAAPERYGFDVDLARGLRSGDV